MTRLSAISRLLSWPRRTWRLVRALSGDDAYERYIEHCRTHHPDDALPDRRQFYLGEQERRYSDGPTGCC